MVIDLATRTYNGKGFVDFFGGEGDDWVSGSDAANMIAGGGGADRLVGAGGDDIVIGDRADYLNGLLRGGDGFDTLVRKHGIEIGDPGNYRDWRRSRASSSLFLRRRKPVSGSGWRRCISQTIRRGGRIGLGTVSRESREEHHSACAA